MKQEYFTPSQNRGACSTGDAPVDLLRRVERQARVIAIVHRRVDIVFIVELAFPGHIILGAATRNDRSVTGVVRLSLRGRVMDVITRFCAAALHRGTHSVWRDLDTVQLCGARLKSADKASEVSAFVQNGRELPSLPFTGR